MQVLKVKGEVGSDGSLHLDIPTQLSPGPVELVVVLGSGPQVGNGSKYDFTDLSGKLSWQGDAVAVQRKLRDEW
jgi:hypothetical protein